jgi:hypothetical protein
VGVSKKIKKGDVSVDRADRVFSEVSWRPSSLVCCTMRRTVVSDWTRGCRRVNWREMSSCVPALPWLARLAAASNRAQLKLVVKKLENKSSFCFAAPQKIKQSS